MLLKSSSKLDFSEAFAFVTLLGEFSNLFRRFEDL